MKRSPVCSSLVESKGLENQISFVNVTVFETVGQFFLCLVLLLIPVGRNPLSLMWFAII